MTLRKGKRQGKTIKAFIRRGLEDFWPLSSDNMAKWPFEGAGWGHALTLTPVTSGSPCTRMSWKSPWRCQIYFRLVPEMKCSGAAASGPTTMFWSKMLKKEPKPTGRGPTSEGDKKSYVAPMTARPIFLERPKAGLSSPCLQRATTEHTFFSYRR